MSEESRKRPVKVSKKTPALMTKAWMRGRKRRILMRNSKKRANGL